MNTSFRQIMPSYLKLSTCLLFALYILAACSSGSAPLQAGGPDPDDESDDPDEPGECSGFGDWQSSPFVLPYPPGTSHTVNQANCSGFGHSDFWKYGYDFIMDIGTAVTVARSGQVGWANDGCSDGMRSCTNLITVIHSDQTVALYSHLTNGGVLVQSGDQVAIGDTIGYSGDTGNTGGLPHLHFSLHPCNELPGLGVSGNCPTIPVNFRNTAPNPEGLEARKIYGALDF